MRAHTLSILSEYKSRLNQSHDESELLLFFKNEFQELQQLQDIPDMDVLFMRLYIHTCLLNKKIIADWLEHEVFPSLPIVQQIAIRHVFAYGHSLQKRHSSR